MGMECPNGHGRQNVVLNITPDMKTTARIDEVVAKKLACGCVVGGEEYQAFLEEIHNINVQEQKSIEQLRKQNASRRAAAFKGLQKAKQGA